MSNEGDAKLNEHLVELTKKIGFLDLREFIALNRFIIEGEQHTDLINQLKSKFVGIALERMDKVKADEVKKIFKV